MKWELGSSYDTETSSKGEVVYIGVSWDLVLLERDERSGQRFLSDVVEEMILKSKINDGRISYEIKPKRSTE